MSVIIFLIILAVLIFVHELGHFIVAKKSGIRVDEFGLGFPPKIYSKKIGETLYTLNTIPFGGFVKIFGEDAHIETISDAEKSGSFYYKPKWIKASVLAAGVVFNIIFAWFLISWGLMLGLPAPAGHSSFGEVRDLKTIVTEILPDSPADKGGLLPGDYILSVSSGKIVLLGGTLTPENVQQTISQSKGQSIELTYKRGSAEPKDISLIPDVDIIPGKKAVGIAMDSVGILKLPVHLAVLEGARITYLLLKTTTVGLLGFLGDVITFKSDFSQISGPVGIASVVSEAKNLGFVYLLSLVALISINLAVINLFPFPALDGGRLFFLLIEAIINRPIPGAFVRYANVVGFGLLILLMIVVTSHDILKLF